MPRIFLRKKITTPLSEGFPWIFEGDIGEEEGDIPAGAVVPVFTHNGSFVGKGFYTPASKIKVRILSRSRNEEIDIAWWRRQLQKCWQFRQRLGLHESCRLVYGEGDGLPGLIVDKLGDYLSVQSLTAGMDVYLELIGNLLQEILSPNGILLRNDAASRPAEGLEKATAFPRVAFDTNITFSAGSILAHADLAQSPQTHFHLDTRLISEALTPLIKAASVLTPFCRTGIFETLAAANGAASVQALLTEEKYRSAAEKTSRANGTAEKISFLTGNAFDHLKQGVQEGKKFDCIFLDPPNFAKGKSNLPAAQNAWRELNLRAMQQLNSGGFLATTVRSHLIQTGEFTRLLQICARSAGRQLHILQTGGLPPDFPRMPLLPQGDYLKFVLVTVS